MKIIIINKKMKRFIEVNHLEYNLVTDLAVIGIVSIRVSRHFNGTEAQR